MRKLWVGKTYGSAAVKGKAGVLILIHKNLPCDIVSSTQDEEGHLLTVHLRVSSKNLVVTNVYAPNSPTKSFFQTVTSHLAPFLQFPLLIGGDFNSVMDIQEDKCKGKPILQSRPRKTEMLLSSFAADLQLSDPWRLAHPEGREYSFYSSPNHTLSRIDYLLCNSTLLTNTSETLVHDIAISDHAPISLLIHGFGPSPPHGHGAFPNSWPKAQLSRKPYKRIGQSTNQPMLPTAMTPTYSGMRARLSCMEGS